MKRGAGKGKGNAFESQIAKQLSRWFTSGEDPDQLIPSRMSGGWIGTEGAQGWRQVGDLAPNGEQGDIFRRHFAVECKHHRTIDFWHFFTRGPGENLMGWWSKLQGEILSLGESSPPVPLLIFRMNYRPIMVGTLPILLDTTTQNIMILEPWNLGILPLDHFLNAGTPENYYGGIRVLWELNQES